MGEQTYVRLIVRNRDSESNSWQGLFTAAYALRELELERHERDVLERALDWFRMHLKIPSCLGEPENRRAICWFKDRAQKPLEYARDLAWLLTERGVQVEQVTTRDVGTIIYEDGWQVAAKPRKSNRLRG